MSPKEVDSVKAAYFDCYSGASGDMILGALIDSGLELEVLKTEIAKLGLTHYDIQVRPCMKSGILASQAVVNVDEDHHSRHHRHLRQIEQIIQDSALDENVKSLSIKVFRGLAEAEARVHGISTEKIHFHEVGAMDAIIDVVGAVAGLTAMGIDRIYCSPLNVGTGTVECAHGILPVPAPATAEIVKGRPVFSNGVQGELLTPTGAAILTTLSAEFGPMPLLTVDSVGYGAGKLETAMPNLLRLVLGRGREEEQGYQMDRVAVVEANIDDMNPQMYDHLIAKAFEAGSLDVFLSPAQMKKNRPGTQVTVICPIEALDRIADLLLRETTTIGLRWRIDNRIKANRSVRKIHTRFGPLSFKVAEVDHEVVNVTPEYDECRRLALDLGVPLKDVMEHARAVGLETITK